MKEALLLAAVFAVFVFVYFLMAKLDKYLSVNRKSIDKEDEKAEPSCIMITEDASEEEVLEEMRSFRQKHKNMRILVYDAARADVSEHPENQIHMK